MGPCIRVATKCVTCCTEYVQSIHINQFYDYRNVMELANKVLVHEGWRRGIGEDYHCCECYKRSLDKTSVTEVSNQPWPPRYERIGCVPLAFALELGKLINKHSVDNELETPDFMLAAYLVDCLNAWSKINDTREQWFGRKPKPCQSPMEDGTVVVKAHRVVRGIRVPEEEDDKCN